MAVELRLSLKGGHLCTPTRQNNVRIDDDLVKTAIDKELST